MADPSRKVIVAFKWGGEQVGIIGSAAAPVEAISLAVVGNEIKALDRWRHILLIFSYAGVFKCGRKWEEIRMPTAFAYDKLRQLYFVANPQWMVIDVFDKDGKNVVDFGQFGDGVNQLRGIDAIFADAQGRVYSVDSQQGKVLSYRAGKP